MRTGRVATSLAGAALIVAICAGILASIAFSRTGDRATASAAADAPTSTVSDTTTAPEPLRSSTTSSASSTSTTSSTTTTSSSTTTTAGGLETGALPTIVADYMVAYQDQALTAAPTSNYGNRYLDLDEPAVLTSNGSTSWDVSVAPESGGPTMKFDSGRVAVATAEITPAGCADLIRRSPSNTTIGASRDLVVCVVTDGSGGVGQVDSPKVAVLRVTSVEADGSVQLMVSAWTIPA